MIMSLGLFQLESLVLARAPGALIDLRKLPMMVPSPRVQACLSTAQVVDPRDLEGFLKRQNLGQHSPVILMCEDGQMSNAFAQKLLSKGFTQVYTVEGGTDGLLRETDDLPSSRGR